MTFGTDEHDAHGQSSAQVPLYDKGSREEEAELSLKRTNVGPATAWMLCAVFLVTVFSEMVLQHVAAIRQYLAAGDNAPRRMDFQSVQHAPDGLEVHPTIPPAGRSSPGAHVGLPPRAYRVVELLPRLAQVRAARSLADYWHLLPPEERIKEFETSLEEASVISACVMPRTQEILTGLGGAGNEKAYCGRGPWLFYRPEVDYLTGRGFLDPAGLQQRSRGNEPVQPDPREAVLDFARQLKARGIELVLMPVPSKPMVHPEFFSARLNGQSGPLQNSSYEQFRQEMEAAGIVVFDETTAMIAAKQAGAPQFLQTDTHWRPEVMEAAARRLAAVVCGAGVSPGGAAGTAAPQAPSSVYKQQTAEIENLGDIAMMLKLPDDQRIYAPERIAVRPVVTAADRPWQSSPSAEVLLLGDSYTNIYSVAAMGWGEGAGLAEQLSFALQCPVDRISRNDSGAFATREMLRGELARGIDRLAGKKVVIWEFAMRELAEGDWKMIDLPGVAPPAVPAVKPQPEPALPQGKFLDLAAGKAVQVTATVAAVSSPPRANSPYKDYLMQFHLTDVRSPGGGELDGDQALVFLLTMKDRKILAPAHWKPGQRVVLRLSAWGDAAKKYDSLRRSELEGELLLEPLCFGDYQH